jgi:hypothetical protein
MEKEQQVELKRKIIIEKIQSTKKVNAKKATELLMSMEIFCELVIKYTLKDE